MGHNLAPMEVCERLIGKPEAISAAAGMGQKTAYHWRHERFGRAAGDLPSTIVQRALLAHSDHHGLGLLPQHLIFGATEAEIAAILAARGSRPASLEAAE